MEPQREHGRQLEREQLLSPPTAPEPSGEEGTTDSDVEGHSWAAYEFGRTVASDRAREAQRGAERSRLLKDRSRGDPRDRR